MMFRSIALLCLASSATAWTLGPALSRRNVMNTIAAGTILASPAIANAMEACPPKSQNCIRATWSPPSGTSQKDAVKAVRDVINAYPQEGQANVDGGGWVVAEDNLDSSGTGRVEYKSSGKGNFAKFFNGGKPFTDDLLIEVGEDGKVELKSSSRVGESDFGVNKVRFFSIICYGLNLMLCFAPLSFFEFTLAEISLLRLLLIKGSRGLPLKRNQGLGMECCRLTGDFITQ